MAKLTETEKAQLARPTPRPKQREPRLAVVSAKDYVAFATLASNATPAVLKPAHFPGGHWKL